MDEYIERETLQSTIIDAQASLETDNDSLWNLNEKYHAGLAWAHRLLLEAPAADVVEVEAVKEWLYQIALSNVGVHFEDVADVCERIIENLDGLRLFAKERRNDG